MRDAADAAGVPRRHLRYGAFGGVLDAGGAATGADPLPRHGFTGHQRERDLGGGGLLYMNARYYDPALGRFVSQDPAGFGGGLDNLYGYVGNDAVNATDPTGMFPWKSVLKFAAVSHLPGGLFYGVPILAHNDREFANDLADFGRWGATRLGVDSVTIPLGFASLSFGRGENGAGSFGYGAYVPIGGGFNFGMNTLVSRDARGRIDAGVGATVGYGVSGLGVNAGVSPTGDLTAGVSVGPEGGPISVGPSGTYGKNGFSGGVGGNLSVGAPGFGGSNYRPALNLGGGVSGGNLYGEAGLGWQLKNPDKAQFVSAAEANATFTEGRGLTGYTLGVNPLNIIEATAAQRAAREQKQEIASYLSAAAASASAGASAVAGGGGDSGLTLASLLEGATMPISADGSRDVYEGGGGGVYEMDGWRSTSRPSELKIYYDEAKRRELFYRGRNEGPLFNRSVAGPVGYDEESIYYYKLALDIKAKMLSVPGVDSGSVAGGLAEGAWSGVENIGGALLSAKAGVDAVGGEAVLWAGHAAGLFSDETFARDSGVVAYMVGHYARGGGDATLPLAFGRDAVVGAYRSAAGFVGDVFSGDADRQSKAFAGLGVGALLAAVSPGGTGRTLARTDVKDLLAGGLSSMRNHAGFADPAQGRALQSFSAAEVTELRFKHQALLTQLEGGGMAQLPSTLIQNGDRISWTRAGWTRTMGELTVATGREVGLVKLGPGRRRYLVLGASDSIVVPPGTQRFIAHTHPSGTLEFSGMTTSNFAGDLEMFGIEFPWQRSHVLIAPDGKSTRLNLRP